MTLCLFALTVLRRTPRWGCWDTRLAPGAAELRDHGNGSAAAVVETRGDGTTAVDEDQLR